MVSIYSRILSLSIVIALQLTADPTFAESVGSSVVDDVNALYAKGHAQLEAHEYDQAYDSFDRAYKLRNSPHLLYKMARAKQLGQHLKEALDLYERALKGCNHWLVLPEQEEAKKDTCDAADAATRAIHGELARAADEEKAKLWSIAKEAQIKAEKANDKIKVLEDRLSQQPKPVPPVPLSKRPWFVLLMVGVGSGVAIGVGAAVTVGLQNQPPAPPVGDLSSRTINF